MKNNIIFLFAITSICASAQVLPDKDPSEIHIHIGGGLSSIHHQLAPRDGFFNGSALEFGLGYTYYLNRNWGVYVGAGPGIYNTQKFVELDVLTPNLTDQNGYIFDLYTQANYREAFQTRFLNIPVMLQYQKKKNNQWWWQKYNRYKGFYLMGGIKVSIPLDDNRYESEITSITNAAYYPELNNWAATQRFAGLGVFDDVNSSNGRMAFVTPCLRLNIEAGLKWRIGNNLLLYTGTYCDIGLRSTLEYTQMPIRNYIAVDHLTDFILLTYSEKIDMITAGVILRLAFLQTSKRLSCSFDPYRGVRR